jgi:site-specific DNA recombinase
MERPALARMLEDVKAKRVDCVVVYKVDRLSRSLLDFASIIGLLDKLNVSFVSVTQQFNTNTSLGRLTLNILLSFAQFEREIISERTRDKVFAARRKGKWTGGHPMLGYDLDLRGGKLLVNEAEAGIVLGIFRMFLKERTLLGTLYEVDRRGWKSKAWVTRTGKTYGGRRFTRHTLEFLLANPIYIGKVRLKGELHPGEHATIVDVALWTKVNKLLAEGHRAISSAPAGPLEAILRGLLFCGACDAPMVPTYTLRRRTRVRYYACLSAQKRGWKTCPSGRVPAQAIEASVLERIGAGDVAELVERITYQGETREVTIKLRGNEGSFSGARA